MKNNKQIVDPFDKFNKIAAQMEELEMKRKDKYSEFVKTEGLSFLSSMKFYNHSLDP